MVAKRAFRIALCAADYAEYRIMPSSVLKRTTVIDFGGLRSA